METNIASARMACGIAQSLPQVFQSFAEKPASPTHLVGMALEALHALDRDQSLDGWLCLLTADLDCGEPDTPKACSEVLKELAHGITLSTETSDLYEVSQCDMPPAYRMAYALMGSADDYGEPDPYGYAEQQPALPLAIATGLSLAGLIFPEGDPVPWPNSSPYWRALVFFDASSGNELVDLRSGTVDIAWDGLDLLRETIIDARRYLDSAVAFMRTVDEDDPVTPLIAWAGHLRRDLRRALARTDRKEDSDARTQSP